jgi:hypothetical protein
MVVPWYSGSETVIYAGLELVEINVRLFLGRLSMQPLGRPVCLNVTVRVVSRWLVSRDHVRPFQISRIAFSLTPKREATSTADDAEPLILNISTAWSSVSVARGLKFLSGRAMGSN